MKKKDNENPETPEEETPETPAEETPEEETSEEEEKELEDFFSKKIDGLIQAIKDTPLRKSVTRDGDITEKSVLETDLVMRRHRPFISLSQQMKTFADNIKIIARGGVPKIDKTVIVGDDPSGGFLVPDEFHAEVIRYATEGALVRPRARVFPMGTDKMPVPTLDQSADHFGGVELFYAGETVPVTERKPTFGKITLSVNKLIGLVPISNEMLADSAINITNFLVALFGEALNYKEDKMFLAGNGVGKPLGIIADARIPEVVRATANRIKFEDITKLYEGLPAWATPRAAWLTTKKGVGQLMRIRADAVTAGDQAGAMLFTPAQLGMQSAVPMLLHGLPILQTDKLPAVGTKGDLVLGDLGYYYIGDKGGIQVASSIHARFKSDEVEIRFTKRHDGQPGIPKAFVVLK